MTHYNSVVKKCPDLRSRNLEFYEDDRRRINGTERDALRRSARNSRLDRKMNECIRDK